MNILLDAALSPWETVAESRALRKPLWFPIHQKTSEDTLTQWDSDWHTLWPKAQALQPHPHPSKELAQAILEQAKLPEAWGWHFQGPHPSPVPQVNEVSLASARWSEDCSYDLEDNFDTHIVRWVEPKTEKNWNIFWNTCRRYATTGWILGYWVSTHRQSPKPITNEPWPRYDVYARYLNASTPSYNSVVPSSWTHWQAFKPSNTEPEAEPEEKLLWSIPIHQNSTSGYDRPPSPGYAPTSGYYHPTDDRPQSPDYGPKSPEYRPESPDYGPTHYHPTDYRPQSPDHGRKSPAYSPSSAQNTYPHSPHNATNSVYRPTSPLNYETATYDPEHPDLFQQDETYDPSRPGLIPRYLP